MYKHIKQNDRVCIALMLRQAHTKTQIGKELGFDRSTISREIKRNSKGKDRIYKVSWANKQAKDRRKLSKVNYRIIDNDLKLQLSKEEIISLIYEYRKASRGWLRLYPGVFDVLSRLSKEYILSTASHTQGCFTQIELQEMDIEQFFSHFIYTSDIGFRKESVDFYKSALEIVGKKPTDCWMIGDNYDVDVLVPQSLGIKAVWLKNPATSDRYAEYIKGRKPQNSIDLENIRELPDLIDSIV